MSELIKSTVTQSGGGLVLTTLRTAFSAAAQRSSTEVGFFRELLSSLRRDLPVKVPGLNVSCRAEEVHQRPRVRVPSRNFSCELGDLLVVVKYRLRDGTVERKSLIYQVKLSSGRSGHYQINANQLSLLSDWPSFEFGRANGLPQRFDISPLTTEFGSYLLFPRQRAEILINGQCGPLYCKVEQRGVGPTARAIRLAGPSSVRADQFPTSRGEVHNFFAHLCFEVGEHHDWNPQVRNLVDAIYRFAGWQPDPPDEFRGFYNDTKNPREEFGFAIIEFLVEPSEK